MTSLSAEVCLVVAKSMNSQDKCSSRKCLWVPLWNICRLESLFNCSLWWMKKKKLINTVLMFVCTNCGFCSLVIFTQFLCSSFSPQPIKEWRYRFLQGWRWKHSARDLKSSFHSSCASECGSQWPAPLCFFFLLSVHCKLYSVVSPVFESVSVNGA